MEIRGELPADRPAILRLTDAAFRQPAARMDAAQGDPVETRLLGELFEDSGYLPEFSVVAVEGGAVVGHAIATRGLVGDEPALGLGPIAVEPSRQGRGVGGALLGELRRRAAECGERVIVLLGHTGYYPRFGYRPAAELGIAAPEPAWGEHFMALDLDNGPVPTGEFRYAEPFNRL